MRLTLENLAASLLHLFVILRHWLEKNNKPAMFSKESQRSPDSFALPLLLLSIVCGALQ
jgi:hypothetical protein